MEFEGRVAVITGAANGIGRSCAELFIERGGSLVLGDIDLDEGLKLQAELGDRALFLEANVRDLAAIQALAAKAVNHFGGLDILVNNAAVALNGAVDEIDEDRWQTVIDTNLTGFWRAMKACVPHMRERGGGSIVNMSSVQGLRAFKGWPAYAAAKGAINALTVQTAADLAPAGIRVNAVAPGTIMTPMNEKIFAAMDDPSELIDRWNKAHPIGRFGYPNEVAETVAFLASDRSSFITGEILRVDGGLAIKGD
ncbi:SDR family NAD(P)-dependent oxidoreductase [Roseibium sp. MMSF_3412]|uniref:SDR family NAD(P)-dependent oxidoreductase n=1 Tax=Roseibium sp. MMSF_3412 TaxID=3046712 RepID=UPI00273E1292|nr:SDR family NAD(P)-dependent oxidoreductase [Roseibium sp. MMSF_3412]